MSKRNWSNRQTEPLSTKVAALLSDFTYQQERQKKKLDDLLATALAERKVVVESCSCAPDLSIGALRDVIAVIERVEYPKIERGEREVSDWLAQVLQVLVTERDLLRTQMKERREADFIAYLINAHEGGSPDVTVGYDEATKNWAATQKKNFDRDSKEEWTGYGRSPKLALKNLAAVKDGGEQDWDEAR